MNDILKLDNQLCFQLYKANRLMTKLYKPLLEKFQITYPQYLVLLVLFEYNHISVKEIGHYLDLDSGTLTPLLKRMENSGYIHRVSSKEDERKVIISLSNKGESLESSLIEVPLMLCKEYDITRDEIIHLRETIKQLTKKIGH